MKSYDLAIKITDWLLRASRGSINLERRDQYRYGIEIILTTFGGMLAILFVAVVMGIEKSVLAYVLPFSFLRVGMGGQHAKTHSKCIICYVGIMLAVIGLAKVLVMKKIIVEGMIVLVFYNLVLLLYQVHCDLEINTKIKSLGKIITFGINVLVFICLVLHVTMSIYMIIILGAFAVELTSAVIKELQIVERKCKVAKRA